jgi:transposase-like protein
MDVNTNSRQVERLEIVETGRRRRWSEDEKLKIAFESLQPPGQMTATAHRYGISRSQLYLWRRNRTFAGSQRGADRAAFMLTMIMTCRLNDVDPKAWLADVLARIADLPASRLHELLPWEWSRLRQPAAPVDQQAA